MRFAEHLKRIRSKEAEIAQASVVRREEFRASLVEQAEAEKTNLSSVFAISRGRSSGGSSSD
jgi:hypothetical protein